ncbi:biofilm formation regulator BssS [Sodalis sp. dw_96]|uniref:biofilm formation regulator BssS n=1 Tax=Sodalis sp. dw_96 TaxID=2719794 RepID=UPI001BD47FB8|nr:biofilm formation regulator BssS [Sodalis sp. dw_96]
MDRKNEIIHTHPLVGWDISTVDTYNAMMIRLHYINSTSQAAEDAEVDRTLWLTTDVAKQLISILEAGIAKIESTAYQDLDHRKH